MPRSCGAQEQASVRGVRGHDGGVRGAQQQHPQAGTSRAEYAHAFRSERRDVLSMEHPAEQSPSEPTRQPPPEPALDAAAEPANQSALNTTA
mmetsp:Transcript_5568/g.14732  ORF Transcript_5568/g.14732 Transcript_5568/m.14732 type:complete len:92 (-) Transcript_5568:1357-1632(-)